MWRAVLNETRNVRKLIQAVQLVLVKYCTDKGVTAGEVNTSPPEGDTPSDMKDHVDEWEGYAKSAGVRDDVNIANVGRFMKQTSGTTWLPRVLGQMLWLTLCRLWAWR